FSLSSQAGPCKDRLEGEEKPNLTTFEGTLELRRTARGSKSEKQSLGIEVPEIGFVTLRIGTDNPFKPNARLLKRVGNRVRCEGTFIENTALLLNATCKAVKV